MKKHVLFGAVLALVTAGPALGQEPASKLLDSEGRLSLNLPSSTGLTGMRDLIDARVPEGFSARGMIRFDDESQNLDSTALSHSLDKYATQLVLGGSIFGAVDFGFSIPLEIQSEVDKFHGGPLHRVTSDGVGDATFAAKGSFALGPWIYVGPYATLQLNSGSANLQKMNELTIGGAGTVAVYDNRIAGHLNFSSVSFDGGKWAISYRVGASYAPIATREILLRVFSYLDGKEYVGSRTHGNDALLFGGVQGVFLGYITGEISFGWRVLSGTTLDHVKDTGTYAFDFGAGASIQF
jgi:hypothetical protein